MAKIAIVEDNADALELFSYVLQNGYEIQTFANGQDFLKQHYPGLFALIILDLLLPDMDGFELHKKILARGDNTTPVVALTARVFPSDMERVSKEGFCDYFLKPIADIEKFRQQMFNHVGRCDTTSSSLHKRPA